jgi:uncharacterized protein (TIGR03086 family)
VPLLSFLLSVAAWSSLGFTAGVVLAEDGPGDTRDVQPTRRQAAAQLSKQRHALRGTEEVSRAAFERQSEAAGTDPVTTCRSAVRSARVASAEPGALERTVHHLIGDIPRSRLLVMRTADSVVHSWDLATAIGVDPGLDQQLVEFVHGHYAPRAQSGALYATGWIAAPRRPLPEGATHPISRRILLSSQLIFDDDAVLHYELESLLWTT